VKLSELSYPSKNNSKSTS